MKTLQLIHVTLVSLWLECHSVLVKVAVVGVDLSLHARVRMLILKVSRIKPFPRSGNVCPTLDDPANGNLVLSGNTFGETALYTCNTGFILVGDSTLTCRGDGQWSGSPPVCNRKYLSKMYTRLLLGKGRGVSINYL